MTKRSSWALPYFIFLVFFVVLPLLLVLVYALQDGSGHFTLSNVTKFFTDSDALSTFAVSIEIAIETTLLCILIGYPAAWILSNKEYNRSAVTIVLFIMPMWINALMRTLATAELFNVLGIHLGKGTLLYGMVYDYLPFMIYPIYNVLDKMDKSYVFLVGQDRPGPRSHSVESVLEGHCPSIHAGRCQRGAHGIHADSEHVCHLGIPHQQQNQALRYDNSGEHQLLHVELRRRSCAYYAGNHRFDKLPSR